LIWIIVCVLAIAAIAAGNLRVVEKRRGGLMDPYRRLLVEQTSPRRIVVLSGIGAVAGLAAIAIASHAPWYYALAIVMVGTVLAVAQHRHHERLRRARDRLEEA
jgi:hypothetical protein